MLKVVGAIKVPFTLSTDIIKPQMIMECLTARTPYRSLTVVAPLADGPVEGGAVVPKQLRLRKPIEIASLALVIFT